MDVKKHTKKIVISVVVVLIIFLGFIYFFSSKSINSDSDVNDFEQEEEINNSMDSSMDMPSDDTNEASSPREESTNTGAYANNEAQDTTVASEDYTPPAPEDNTPEYDTVESSPSPEQEENYETASEGEESTSFDEE